ncbi:MAG: hypothetical protein QOD60_602 [Solirubrobacterales bacterium]|nr:hypothetical protein [Solirubrobacterales bacterium]
MKAVLAGLVGIALACAGCHAAGPSSAHASQAQLTIVDASKEATGLYGERRRAAAVPELGSLGADVIRIVVYWVDVAPKPHSIRAPRRFQPRNSASYGGVWTPIDRTVRDAARHGIKVMLVPTGRFPHGVIPHWARRHPGKDKNVPRPGAYRAFVQALGSRYSGRFDPDGRGPQHKLPAARFISIWNEPNSAAFLEPHDRAPEVYRRLVEAASRGLAAAHWHGTLLAGETSQGGTNQTPPVEFMRRTLCLPPGFNGPPSCPPLPVNGWSHHPYSLGMTPWQVPADPDLVTSGSLSRLTGPLAKAEALGALPPSGLYITEYGYETVPDPLGISFGEQAEFDSIGERIAYENPMVASFAQYLLRDDPPLNGTYHAFESGLRTHNSGVRPCLVHPVGCKPSWFAFRTPLAVRLAGNLAEVWGRVRPARRPTVVTINFTDSDGSSGALANVHTDSAGYFAFETANVAGRRWSLTWDGRTAPSVKGYAY